MNIIGIIPARLAATRFPNKPLAKISGRAMIEHVYERSKIVKVLSEVYVATCDKEIEDFCRDKNMKVVMTSDKHQRASDRTAEAMISIEEATGKNVDIVVMIQGDEPMLTPEMVEKAVEPMIHNEDICVVNLMGDLKNAKEWNDPNEVKVVVDGENNALYFSREALPYLRGKSGQTSIFKQVCIIPFKRDFLIKFNALKTTALEQIESVDMLRVLEHGYKVKMVYLPYTTYSVDTPEDLKRVENMMRETSAI